MIGWMLASAIDAYLHDQKLVHGGTPLIPSTLWQAWRLDPFMIVPMGLLAILYWRGFNWRSTRRGPPIAFTGGLMALVVALVSPFHALAEILFSAHMAQHLLLIVVAAPLLVLSQPVGPLVKALPDGWRAALSWVFRTQALRPVLLALKHPLAAWVLHVSVLYLWHIPALFQAAIEIEWLHAAEHVTLLATGLVYWVSILAPGGSKAGVYGAGVLSLFVMMMQCSLLGAVMTFAPAPWYAVDETSAAVWGLTALADQQLAGLLMWIPGGTIYLGAAIGLGAAWFQAVEKRSLARSAFRDAKERGY